jgi:hypothetical protein
VGGVRQAPVVAAETVPAQVPASYVLDQLLRAKGLQPGEYALFFVVGEGVFFQVPGIPLPIEEASGFVLDHRGAVYAFWLKWDTREQRPVLNDWEHVAPEPSWNGEPEYQDARRRLGLPAAI